MSGVARADLARLGRARDKITHAPSIERKAASRLPPPPDFAGGAEAVTLSDLDTDPPGPAQLSASVSVPLMDTATLPLVDCTPDQPVPPLAVQVVAFCELHVKVAAWPAATVAALEVKVKVGGVDDTLTVYRP